MRYVHSSTIEYRRGPAVDLSAPEAPSGNNIQRPLLVVTALSLSVSVALLLYLTLPSEADFHLAVATSIPVASLILCMMFARPSITDATFIFMCWAFIYQVIEPWLLVTGVAQVIAGSFFLNNYRLLAQGNLYFSVGLVAYGLGIVLCRYWGTRHSSRLLTTTDEANILVLVLLVVSFLSWLAMWLRAGAPIAALLLIRPSAITRNQAYVGYGYGYLLDLALGTNVAILVYSLFHPTKSLLSLKMAGFIACILLFNGMRGSRMVFFLAPVSVLLLKHLLATRSAAAKFKRGGRRYTLAVVVTALVCVALALPYTEYREGRAARAELQRSGWAGMLTTDAASLFWESLTYYMVLQRVPKMHPYWLGRGYAAPLVMAIPRVIFRDKFSHIWNDRQFVEEFFGYDEFTFGATAKGGDLLAYEFLNFGLVGIIGEMFALGMLNEYLGRKARSHTASNLFTVVYIYYVSYFMLDLWKSGLANAVNYVEVPLLELFVLTWLVASVRPHASAVLGVAETQTASRVSRVSGDRTTAAATAER
jgi:hypothetical protein